MREIKYQAWDTKDKRMIEWQELLDYGSGLVEYIINPRELIFREYTGLQDCNNEDIYEGDIVKLTSVLANNDEYLAEAVMRGWESSFEAFRDTDNGFYCPMGATARNYREVIGNIYENPELLWIYCLPGK